jgi:hypothetical protein
VPWFEISVLIWNLERDLEINLLVSNQASELGVPNVDLKSSSVSKSSTWCVLVLDLDSTMLENVPMESNQDHPVEHRTL